MSKTDLLKSFGILAVSSAMFVSGFSKAETGTITTPHPSADSRITMDGQGATPVSAATMMWAKALAPTDKAPVQSTLIAPNANVSAFCIPDQTNGCSEPPSYLKSYQHRVGSGTDLK